MNFLIRNFNDIEFDELKRCWFDSRFILFAERTSSHISNGKLQELMAKQKELEVSGDETRYVLWNETECRPEVCVLIAHVSDDPNEALLMCRYDVPAFFGSLPEMLCQHSILETFKGDRTNRIMAFANYHDHMLQGVYSRIPLIAVPEGEEVDCQYEDIVGQYFYLNSDDPAIEEWDVDGVMEMSGLLYAFGQSMTEQANKDMRNADQLDSAIAN
jgi:hypothetical protein